ADRGADELLAGVEEASRLIDVALVADDDVCPAYGVARGRRSVGAVARTEPDHGQRAGTATGNSDGRHRALAFGRDQLGGRPGGQEGGRLGHAGGTDSVAHLAARIGDVDGGERIRRKGDDGEAQGTQMVT